MANNKVSVGAVFQYPYLWHWQYERGETEGRKNRQSVVALTAEKAEVNYLFLLPITSKRPDETRVALPVPEAERKRANLDNIDLWIIFDECNIDSENASYYFQPNAPMTKFSAAFTEKITEMFMFCLRKNTSAKTLRL